MGGSHQLEKQTPGGVKKTRVVNVSEEKRGLGRGRKVPFGLRM